MDKLEVFRTHRTRYGNPERKPAMSRENMNRQALIIALQSCDEDTIKNVLEQLYRPNDGIGRHSGFKIHSRKA